LKRVAWDYPAYPYAVIQLPHNWAAGALQWTAAIAADTKEELEVLMHEDVALQLLDASLDGRTLPGPQPRDQLNLRGYDEYAAEQPYQVAYLHPAWLSVDSVAILRALQARGVSKGELAKRLRVRPAVVERLTDPFYFHHTADSVRRVADALDMDTVVRLVKRAELRDPQDAFSMLPLR